MYLTSDSEAIWLLTS